MLKTNIKSILFLVMLCITLFLITTRGDDFFLSEAVKTNLWGWVGHAHLADMVELAQRMAVNAAFTH